jgi:hypothetical protein
MKVVLLKTTFEKALHFGIPQFESMQNPYYEECINGLH